MTYKLALLCSLCVGGGYLAGRVTRPYTPCVWVNPRTAEEELVPPGGGCLFAQLFDCLLAEPPALPDPVIMPLSRIDEAISVARARSHPRVVLDLAA